jgi:S-DNA-T family DNA segregation ATPase FtsK/SpoIIIE
MALARRTQLCLIDFKGGGAFAPLTDLPHVAGLITNMADDAGLVDRVHAALQGEQQRRQQLLRTAGNADSLHEYQRRHTAGTKGTGGEALPHLPYLLIIVDEFGELLSDRPDMADLFVQIGRVGRSLGMHLLMATQRLEEGKLRGLDSHLSYRICLRTFSAPESRAVIGTTDAYRLPPIPGSAYLKVDESVYQRFRVAHVSSPYLSTEERASTAAMFGTSIVPYGIRRAVSATSEDQPGEAVVVVPRSELTELAVVVDRIKMIGRQAHQVWLPPLPSAIPLDALVGSLAEQSGRGLAARDWPIAAHLQVPIGVVDLPVQQEQQPLLVNFSGSHGHLALVGAPQTGRSTFLRTIMLAAMVTHTPDEMQFVCIDFGGGTLHPFANAPHVSSVAGRADVQLLGRTLAEMQSLITERERLFRELKIDSVTEFRARRAAGRLPAGLRVADVFLLIDNWGALRTDYDDADEAVAEIAARGLGVGVHLVLTASRWMEIRPALRDSIGTRMELRLNDPTESRSPVSPVAGVRAGSGRHLSGAFVQLLLPR